jgi:arylsulfatase
MRLDRRSFLKAAAGAVSARALRSQHRRPNVILIYADDLGYGDLGCYGGPLSTPNLDRIAAEGARFTQFYSASPVCSPSRAALLTGRYPTRVDVPLVLGPGAAAGLAEDEVTIAQLLKAAGYRTACIGKWHLGSAPRFQPVSRGFDEYFGIPYSHDMWPRVLMRNRETVEETAEVSSLTGRFTREAVAFIERSKDAPFFLYLPYTAPHIPLAASTAFTGRSGLGDYADVVQEMDWGVGEVLAALQTNGLDDNTIVLFSSDNGPWWQGSQGKLRGRKGETYDGGMKVPFLARWPGVIPAGRECAGMAATLDLLPTLARFCGAPLPAKALDGVDISPLLTGERDEAEREAFLYFDSVYLQCARLGRWKLHVARYNTRAWSPVPSGGRRNLPLPSPELYDVVRDPQESYDCADAHPQVVAEIRARMDRLIAGFPSGIQDAWRDTMSARVEDTPSDGLPVAQTP